MGGGGVGLASVSTMAVDGGVATAATVGVWVGVRVGVGVGRGVAVANGMGVQVGDGEGVGVATGAGTRGAPQVAAVSATPRTSTNVVRASRAPGVFTPRVVHPR